MKKARIEFSETLKAKSREHKDATMKLRGEFEDQLRVQYGQVEARERHNDELKRECERVYKELNTIRQIAEEAGVKLPPRKAQPSPTS